MSYHVRHSRAGGASACVDGVIAWSTEGLCKVDDAIVRDGLADHWAEILGSGLRQASEDVEVGGGPERQLMKIPITLIGLESANSR
jgi:hypothetical protein